MLGKMYPSIRSLFHYHFFTIWPNGFYALDDILDMIRKDPHLEILSIREHSFRSMPKFVHDLYACDAVPVEHLRSKLRYLYELPPRVVNVFVKNFNPQEEFTGRDAFRKEQCKYIVQVKNKIRNLYNARHADPDFHIAPLDKGVTHEHVIHASDREEQVDYYLKLLGDKDGIAHLENNNAGLVFVKPYHIPRPNRYSFQRLPISSLRVNILHESQGRVTRKPVAVKETPHYRTLCSGADDYKQYLHRYRYKYPKDDYSVEKFRQMSVLSPEQLRALLPIVVRPDAGVYLILDGTHRAAVSLFHGFDEIDCVVFEG